jgi:predicted ATP-grasp superfamily ATP-dependent carboligase
MSVAVIRSLGRAGYPVHACSSLIDALGAHSQFVHRAETCPSYQSEEFTPWLRGYCQDHEIGCIVPTEDLLLALRPVYAEFSRLFPLSEDAVTVYKGISKFDLFQALLARQGNHEKGSGQLSQVLLVENIEDIDNEETLGKLDTPLFIKLDGGYSVTGQPSKVVKVATASEARPLVAELLTQYTKLLIQGYSPGVGVGAFLLRWNGHHLAEFMHMRLHEIPLEGWSSYRKSWWHEAIMEDAKAKLSDMDWQGVVMMEYRWNPDTDEFTLIEMNGRFWGSLHLALYCGADFPVLLLDAFNGVISKPVSIVNSKLRSRHIVLEMRYVWSQFKDPQVSITRKLWALIEFVYLTLDPGVKSDILFPGDRRLFLYQVRQNFSRLFHKLIGKTAGV